MKLRRGQEGLINAAADLRVVDEAHNLEDKVRSATTAVSYTHLVYVLCESIASLYTFGRDLDFLIEVYLTTVCF